MKALEPVRDLVRASYLKPWALVLIVVLGTACSVLPGTSSPPAASSPSASAVLDPQVPTPPGFATDLPVYPKARLTAAASFTSTGHVAWGMEWETLDGVAKVGAYFVKQFGQGDWTLKITNQSAAAFSGTIARKSDPQVTGTLAIAQDSGITTIALSLLSGA